MPQAMSREIFRLWAPQQRGRYERVDGVPIAMSPERAGHIEVKMRLWRALDRAVRQAGVQCQAIGDGITVEIDDQTDYEPDATVNCGPRLDPEAIAATNPIVVAEVLSASTQAVDTGAKLFGYFRVSSIRHYLVVSVQRPAVVHYRRDGEAIAMQLIEHGPIRLDPPGIAFDIAEIYED